MTFSKSKEKKYGNSTQYSLIILRVDTVESYNCNAIFENWNGFEYGLNYQSFDKRYIIYKDSRGDTK